MEFSLLWLGWRKKGLWFCSSWLILLLFAKHGLMASVGICFYFFFKFLLAAMFIVTGLAFNLTSLQVNGEGLFI